MKEDTSYLAQQGPCPYLPDQTWRLEYRLLPNMTKAEYLSYIKQGWRRFGSMLFRPACGACTACLPIRVIARLFAPDRSQRRVKKLNSDIRLEIGTPKLDSERIDLYVRHHSHHAETKGWTRPGLDGGVEHINSIIDGPIPVQEWAYYLDQRLVAISYIDALADGLSGIYFYHDPDLRKRSLGTWICLSLIEQSIAQGLDYVYLGYYIKDCSSMSYKGRFTPHEILGPDGIWSKAI